jgi:hypothetical protein
VCREPCEKPDAPKVALCAQCAQSDDMFFPAFMLTPEEVGRWVCTGFARIVETPSCAERPSIGFAYDTHFYSLVSESDPVKALESTPLFLHVTHKTGARAHASEFLRLSDLLRRAKLCEHHAKKKQRKPEGYDGICLAEQPPLSTAPLREKNLRPCLPPGERDREIVMWDGRFL